MVQALPVGRLIQVGVTLTPAGARSQSLSQLLCLSILSTIDQSERYRTYSSLSDVGVDFGTNTDEYIVAQRWFGQKPQPHSIMFGRWCKTQAIGGIKGSPISATSSNLNVATWQAITAGSFAYQVDGGTLANVTGLNFSTALDLNGVAAIIGTAITASATCKWDAARRRFVIESRTLGTTSSISTLSAAGSGTDISGRLNMQTANMLQGGYQYQGIAAEGQGTVYNYFDSNFGQQWYGLVSTACNDANANGFAQSVEASTNKHIYCYTSLDATILLSPTIDTTSIAVQLQALGITRTMLQYSSTDKYAGVAALSKLLSVDYGGNNSVIDLMYKGEVLVVPENLNTTQVNNLEGKGCNVFVQYDNGTAIFEPGQMPLPGLFADQITDTDALAVAVMTRLYNVLYTNPKKLPQTDPGVHVLVTNIEDVCTQFVTNGTLAPGQWNSAGFGALSEGDNLPKGFYVFAPLVANQDPALRAARISPSLQCAVKLAGSIHDVVLSIVVNQ